MSRILDALESTEWTHVGEVPELVHPNDTALLRRLVEACDERMEELRETAPKEPARSERLLRIRRRLHATAELNGVLPMITTEELRRWRRPPPRPVGRRLSGRANLGSSAPGFEAYHLKIVEWLDIKNLSQSKLARHMDVDPSYFSRVIRGERRNRDIYLKLEELSGIAPPIFVGDRKPAEDEEAGGGKSAPGGTAPLT